MENKNLRAAEEYAKRGLSVIPCGKDKKPLLKWESYQKIRADLADIRTWWEKWPDANVGIVTGKVSGVVVIDIDNLEVGLKALQGVCNVMVDTPTAQTPKGMHLYFKCPDQAPGNNTGLISGCDFRGEGGFVVAPPSVSSGGEYLWLPGLSLDDLALPELPPDYLAKLSPAAGGFHSPARKVNTGIKPFGRGRRDDDIFTLAHSLFKNNLNKEYVIQACLAAAAACDPPFPEKEVLIKVKSAEEMLIKKDLDIAGGVREIVEGFTEGFFKASWVTERLQEASGLPRMSEGFTKMRRQIEQTLRRLKETGVIEASGRVSGEYRRVDIDVQPIDFLSAPVDKLDIKWPFGLESLAHTYRKNIVVIAGEPNSGKTAFLLNFVEKNMDKHKINYFSSEMGPTEFRVRLSKFERKLESWTFFPVERSADFQDVIEPDAINVIDFLEITEDFYLVGKFIRQIYDKLGNGICVLALQKNAGTDMGLGGFRSLEKARLYLAMSGNPDGTSRLKIIKAKNWADGVRNPNGLFMEFNLINGCKFVERTAWL